MLNTSHLWLHRYSLYWETLNFLCIHLNIKLPWNFRQLPLLKFNLFREIPHPSYRVSEVAESKLIYLQSAHLMYQPSDFLQIVTVRIENPSGMGREL